MNDFESSSGEEGAQLIGAMISLATSAALLYGAYRFGKANGRNEERTRNDQAASAAGKQAGR